MKIPDPPIFYGNKDKFKIDYDDWYSQMIKQNASEHSLHGHDSTKDVVCAESNRRQRLRSLEATFMLAPMPLLDISKNLINGILKVV